MPADLTIKGGWTVTADPLERNRRSIYVFAKRNLRYPLFTAFDAPDGNETCSRRFTTTTAPQALMLLNDKLILQTARSLAGRVLAQVKPEPDTVVEKAFTLALGRAPDDREKATMRSFLSCQTDMLAQKDAKSLTGPLPAPVAVEPAFAAAVVDLCHGLFNLNEFLYVD